MRGNSCIILNVKQPFRKDVHLINHNVFYACVIENTSYILYETEYIRG